MAQHFLGISDVSVRYGSVHALRSVNVHVDAGEVACILGANGAGKTSLMRAIMGLTPAHSGSITLEGRELRKLPPHKVARAGVGMVPEGRMVFGRLSVRENLLMGSRLGAHDGAETEEQRLDKVLELFPALTSRLDDSGQLLSGGEQQMVAVGRALLMGPRVLLLDEPSLGLAPKLIDEVFEIISTLRSAGVTMLLVEQNAMMALEVADRAYVLQNGRIVFSGSPEEVLSSSDLKDAFLGHLAPSAVVTRTGNERE